MTQAFAGKAVIVTGAAGGIGRAITHAFAARGASVCCFDTNAQGLRDVVEDLAPTDGAGSVHSFVCDITTEESVRNAVRVAMDECGSLDILVNAAGVGGSALTTQLTLEEWSHVLSVNLTGAFLMTREALPHLLVHGGSIVNLASVSGIRASPYNAAYCASKGGLILFTKSIALELGSSGVRANCVCPSGVETTLLKGFALPKGADPAVYSRGRPPIDRLIQPSEVAESVLFLASEGAAMINGTTVVMDGGASS